MNQQVPEQDSLKLKKYFQVGIGLSIIVALVGGIVWFNSNGAAKTSEEVAMMEGLEDLGAEEGMEESMGEEPAPTPEGRKAEPVDLNKASDFFGQSMKHMAMCVGLSNANKGERLDPSFDSLLALVKSDLGDPILRSEDWVTWSLRVGDEERRIRLETDYSDSDQTSRRLSYFKVNKDGQPTLIPLAGESAKDPSEAFIASLQKDGEVYLEEKGERAYFENGQELVLTEKNGKIDHLEFSNGSKTFRCAGILTTTPSCKCY